MSIADRIKAKRAEQDRGFVDVAEWGEGGEPLRLFFMPICARDIENVQRKYKNFLSEPSMSAMVELIIRKAEDADGKSVFTLEDKTVLMGESVGTIAATFGAIFDATSAEDHVKN